MTLRGVGAGVVAATMLVWTVAAQNAGQQDKQFQSALQKEMVAGDLKGAIESYQAITTRPGVSRALAVEALLRMAECYQKLGDSQATKLYERVIREFGDRADAVSVAKTRLGQLGRPPAAPEPVAQRVWAAEDAEEDYFGAVAAQVPPDGSQVVFSEWKDGNIGLRSLKTGEVRFLTNLPRTQDGGRDLVISADGQRVAYQWAGLRKPEPMHITHIDGTHVSDFGPYPGLYLSAWSPDGKQIAAVRSSWDDRAQGLALISATNGTVTSLKSTGWGSLPQIGGYSADGRFLVYAIRKDGPTKSGGIYAIAIDGSREAPLLEGSGRHRDPKWTPDGRGVVFVSDRSGTNDLWFIRVVDGRPDGEPQLVRAEVGMVDLKGFTRDGSLYYGTRQLDLNAYRIDLDPNHGRAVPQRITERLIGSNFEPEPSPDGSMIAFFRDESDVSLVIRATKTGEERTVLRGVDADYTRRNIRWFPDSRSLLLHDWKAFKRIDILTGEARTILETPKPIWLHAELSRDGRALYYSSAYSSPGTLQLRRRDLQSGEEKVLYQVEKTSQAGLYGISLSPDGRELAFMTSIDGNRVLVTMPEDGGTLREVHRAKQVLGEREPLHWAGAAWTGDGRYVLATRSVMTEKQSDELVAFPVGGGNPRTLAVMAGRIFNPSVSPDGRYVTFTGARRSRELWVMRNFLR